MFLIKHTAEHEDMFMLCVTCSSEFFSPAWKTLDSFVVLGVVGGHNFSTCRQGRSGTSGLGTTGGTSGAGRPSSVPLSPQGKEVHS